MLSNVQELQNMCKSLATLDLILCDDWEYRYYSFNSKWDLNEQCFTMKNDEGDELQILFKNNMCVVNGLLKRIGVIDTRELEDILSNDFYTFIYGEPVKSIGTSFCM